MLVTGSAKNNLKTTNLYFKFGSKGYTWVSFAHYCYVKKKKKRYWEQYFWKLCFNTSFNYWTASSCHFIKYCVKCGMVTLRIKEGFLHRNFPTLFSTGMQIPPGSNRHLLYKWRIEIRVSAHFSFLVLVCLQETNCYGFAGWKEVQPSIYLIHTW